MKGVPIVPLAQVRFVPGTAVESIAVLQQRGEIVSALVGAEHVVSGGFSKQIVKGSTVSPGDMRDRFSAQEKTFVAWINWSPQERLRGQSVLRNFDVDNKVVSESKPAKVNLRKGELVLSAWQLQVPSAAGQYRVEVAIDGQPIWRGFLRVTP